MSHYNAFIRQPSLTRSPVRNNSWRSKRNRYISQRPKSRRCTRNDSIARLAPFDRPMQGSPVGVHVYGVVGGGVGQEESGRDDVLPLDGGEDRVTRHQVLHRRPRRASRMDRLDDLQALAAHLRAESSFLRQTRELLTLLKKYRQDNKAAPTRTSSHSSLIDFRIVLEFIFPSLTQRCAQINEHFATRA
jgi:hypothetical protein